MIEKLRRVVTGHDAQGKSMVAIERTAGIDRRHGASGARRDLGHGNDTGRQFVSSLSKREEDTEKECILPPREGLHRQSADG
jgi:hypothetical protein